MEQEIAQLLKKVLKEELAKIPNVEFPDSIELKLKNLPEPKEINLSGIEDTLKQFLNQKREVIAPLEMRKVEQLLGSVISQIKEIRIPEQIDTTELLGKILDKLSLETILPEQFNQEAFFTELKQAFRSMPRSSGGGIGPSKIAFKNTRGQVVDPAVAVGDGDTLSTIDPQGTLIVGKDDKKAQYIKSIKGSLETVDTFDRDLQEQILVELKLISLKLNCLQLDELTVNDLEQI